MSRMALIALVVVLATHVAHAGLCELAPYESAAGRAVDYPDDWQDCYLGCFLAAVPQLPMRLWDPSSVWDMAPLRTYFSGVEIDRRWYAYLDRGRYQFLDVTQYTVLSGPAGFWWRWRHRAWLEAVNLSWSVPARTGQAAPEAIPEPASALLLALGALGALRLCGTCPAARIRPAVVSAGCP